MVLNRHVVIASFSPEPPGAPDKLEISNVGRDSATLSWRKPRYDGGAPIRGYVIQQRDGKAASWSEIGDVDASTYVFVAKGLIEGYEYFFRVAAKNSAGLGEPVENRRPVVPERQMGKSPSQFVFRT